MSVYSQLSQSTQVILRVPQGSLLGPLLFLCYINDMPDKMRSSLRLYADDTLLYRKIHSPEDSKILQEDINRWAKHWMIKFNPIKCEYSRVTNKSLPLTTQCYINQHLYLPYVQDSFQSIKTLQCNGNQVLNINVAIVMHKISMLLLQQCVNHYLTLGARIVRSHNAHCIE